MDEIDYKQPSNPRYFMTVHSAWCPPKRSDFLEITLKKRELSDPCWVDINSNKITYTNVGEIIKMSVKCNEDIELFEDVVFRMYPEGSDISTTQPEATVRGSNINGIAESEELCWGVKKQGNPPDSPTKYFFTAQAKRSPYIVSDVFEIKLPEFSNLSWKKDNENIEIAIDNEYVELTCDTKNIYDYAQVIVEIYEPDENDKDIHLFDVKGKIINNKLEIKWKVDYIEKTGTKSKKEIDEKGYTIPEYHFYVRYFGYKSNASPIVKLKQNFIEKATKKNGMSIINTDYILLCPNGQELKGKTDSKGFIIQNDVFIGNYKIVIAR